MSDFKQPVCWPACVLRNDEVQEFVAFMLEKLHARVELIGSYDTLPDYENGIQVPGTGGRTDLYFYVHSEDLNKFAVARLEFGMRWVEDMIDNEKRRIADGDQERTIYVPEVHALYSWKKD